MGIISMYFSNFEMINIIADDCYFNNNYLIFLSFEN